MTAPKAHHWTRHHDLSDADSQAPRASSMPNSSVPVSAVPSAPAPPAGSRGSVSAESQSRLRHAQEDQDASRASTLPFHRHVNPAQAYPASTTSPATPPHSPTPLLAHDFGQSTEHADAPGSIISSSKMLIGTHSPSASEAQCNDNARMGLIDSMGSATLQSAQHSRSQSKSSESTVTDRRDIMHPAPTQAGPSTATRSYASRTLDDVDMHEEPAGRTLSSPHPRARTTSPYTIHERRLSDRAGTNAYTHARSQSDSGLVMSPKDGRRASSTVRYSDPLLPPPPSARQSPGSPHAAPLSPLMPLVFQPALPMHIMSYSSRLAHLVYFLYPAIYNAHVPVTLFLDANVMYALVQIAVHPSASIQEDEDGRQEQGAKPRANAWWIAVAFYAAATLSWFVAIWLLHDYYYRYRKRWKHQAHPSIMDIYQSSSTFHLSSCRSFQHFSFLWRLRMSAFTGIGSIPPAFRQGCLETCQLFMQNWPTVVTLVPRALASLLLLLSFTSESPRSDTSGSYRRDVLFFESDGNLTTYSVVINLINLSWAVWRLLLVVVAAFGFWCLSRVKDKPSDAIRPPTSNSYTVMSVSGATCDVFQRDPMSGWQRRLQERTLEAVLLCSSSNRWRVSRDDNPVAYRRSRDTRRPGRRSKRRRQSVVSFDDQRKGGETEMRQRPSTSSDNSFSVHLPARTVASAELYQGESSDGRDVRISSIPTRRKNTVSNESTTSSIFSFPNGPAETSHTTLERPFSALGHHNEGERSLAFRPRPEPSHSVTADVLVEDLDLDKDEMERLEWERHPPLTPRGSLVQAREELAQQQKEQQSRSSPSYYWNTANLIAFSPSPVEESLSTGEVAGSSGLDRALGAIVEESEEEASLKRANSLSNRHTVSSRQSSLRRPGTSLSRYDEGAISVIEESSEHGQSASA